MNPDWVTVLISSFALIVSVGSAVFSIHSNTNLQRKRLQFEALMMRKSALEGARASIIGAVREIDAVVMFGFAIRDFRQEEGIDEEDAEEINKSLLDAMNRFMEVREAYGTFNHHLDSNSRGELDRQYDEVSVSYDDVVARERDDPAAIVLTPEELAGLLMWPKQVLETVSKNIEAIESLIHTENLPTSAPNSRAPHH